MRIHRQYIVKNTSKESHKQWLGIVFEENLSKIVVCVDAVIQLDRLHLCGSRLYTGMHAPCHATTVVDYTPYRYIPWIKGIYHNDTIGGKSSRLTGVSMRRQMVFD